jgi:5-methylcytosine-specific restriction endonuclease McrA
MAPKAIPRAVRRGVRERALDRCEYCLHPAAYSTAPYVCEHFVPRSAGGGDTADELAWSCPGCNSHKYAKTLGTDPLTGRRVRIFNPRRQLWQAHFQWSSDRLLIVGHTATGRATVEALRLNRLELVNLRQALLIAGEHPVNY